MPQGVEHRKVGLGSYEFVELLGSLMPQGVEHFMVPGFEFRVSGLLGSLMPQGVEHFGKTVKKLDSWSARISDAARR